MKRVKRSSLVALAALMVVAAIVGVSPAAAESTALCKSDESPCSSGNVITHIHETSVGKAKLESELPTIECNVLFLGDTVGGTGSLIDGKFTYSSCNNFCSLKEVSESGSSIVLLKSGTELAEVTSGSEANVTCPFISCTYNIEAFEGHGLGALTSSSENGNVVISAQELEAMSGICPPETFLDLTTTPLSKTYVVSGGPTMVCSKISRGKYLKFISGTECDETKKDFFRRGSYELGYTPN